MRQHTAEKRAARGAAWLDARFGTRGWARAIHRPLDIRNASTCVLGQVYGSFWVSPFALGLEGLRRYGFMATKRNSAMQAQAWMAEIDKRRIPTAPATVLQGYAIRHKQQVNA